MSSLPKKALAPWHQSEYRAFFYQLVLLLVLFFIGWYLLSNTIENLKRQNIATGFDFLWSESAFEIGEALIPFAPSDSYARALLVGALNTLKTAVIGITLTILLGTLMGIARLAKNGLIAGLAALYIELFRNIPVLLQLFFWYALFHQLPGPRQAFKPFSGVFLCNRGFLFPSPHINGPESLVLLFVPLALLFWWWLCRKNRMYREYHGKNRIHPSAISLVPVLIVIGVNTIAGANWQIDVPALQGFNVRGGSVITPEFGALLIGLVIYTGTLWQKFSFRHFVCKQRPSGSCQIGGTHQQQDFVPHRVAPGASGYCSTAHQPDAQSHQKQLPSRGSRLPRLVFRGQHHPQPDWSGHRSHQHRHVDIPTLQPTDVAIHELVQ